MSESNATPEGETMAPYPVSSLFAALSAVQADLAARGVGKDGTNQYDKYQYRSVDGLMNTIAPLLAKHGVLIMPSVVSRETTQVDTKSGGSQNHTTLTIEYTLYHISGESVCHRVMGEAMDRGDKSINKAMAAAFKYFLFQAFCIPLVGDDEADSESHEVVTQIITGDQFNELQRLCKDTDTDPGDFTQWVTGSSETLLAMLPADLFEKAKRALEKKHEKLYAENESAASDAEDKSQS